MKPTDITVKILEEIRDAVRGTNGRVDSTNERLDMTNARLDVTNARLDELGNRIVESEIRTATAITALAGDLKDVKSLLEDRLNLRDRVERCEKDILVLQERSATK